MGFGSGIRDPGSGKNLFRIPDPEVKKAPDPGSGSATLAKNVSRYCHWTTTAFDDGESGRRKEIGAYVYC
jgi:hypothetical protein